MMQVGVFKLVVKNTQYKTATYVHDRMKRCIIIHVCGLDHADEVLLLIGFVFVAVSYIRLCRLSSVHGLSHVYMYVSIMVIE